MIDWRITAFIESCSEGDLQTFNLLIPDIRKNIGINAPDSNGTTAIAAAIKNSQLEIIERLLDENNINLSDCTDINGKAAIDYFLSGNCWNLTRKLMDTINIDESVNSKLANAALRYAYNRDRNKYKLILKFIKQNSHANHDLIAKILYTGKKLYISEILKHFQGNLENNIRKKEFNTQAITAALANGVISIASPFFKLFEEDFINSLEQAKLLCINSDNISNKKLIKYIFNDMLNHELNEETFDRALPHVNVNYQNNNEYTLLMGIFSAEGLDTPSTTKTRAKFSKRIHRLNSLIKINNLDVNSKNKRGESALYLVQIKHASELEEEERTASELMLTTFNKKIKGILNQNQEEWQALISSDLRILMILSMAKTTPIVDFNCSKSNLIIESIKLQRLDIILFLILKSNIRIDESTILSVSELLLNIRLRTQLETIWSRRFTASLQTQLGVSNA